MPAANDDPATALAIMRDWNWRRCDPDGFEEPFGMDLGSIINRLASEGVRWPEAVILQLLCKGDLLARGVFHWRKHQDLRHYQRDGSFEPISPKRWLRLAQAIQDAKLGGWGSSIETTLQLTELGLKDCLAHVWNAHESSFSYASVTDELDPWDSDYSEELFSAWEIEAWPKFLEEPGPDEIAPSDANKGKPGRGRPAANWWPAFAEELAIAIYEDGFPEGSGHTGQSELLDNVCARLSAAGKPEPSRSTVQPVINAVLARGRSAGK